MKVATFDIEATNLNASFGMLLSACIKPLGKPVKEFSAKITPEVAKRILEGEEIDTDSKLTAEILQELGQHDLIITWYGKRYDVPFMKTRALKHGLPFIDPRIKHVDLYDTARSKLNMHSNRLEAVAEFLGIHGKTKISADAWNRAARGDKKAMAEVVYHNRMDVIVLEKVYNKLKRDIAVISKI